MSAAIDADAVPPAPAALLAYQQRHPEQTRDGWRFRRTTPGAPVMLALPGALGGGDVFYRTAARFAGRFDVVPVDYPAIDDGPALADGIAGLAAAIGGREAVVLTSSLGGYLGQLLAIRHPALVRLLILGNTFRDPTSQQARWPTPDDFAATPAEMVLQDARRRLLDGPADAAPAAELRAALLSLVGTRQDAEAVKAARLTVLRATVQPVVPLVAGRVALIDDDADPVIAEPTRLDLRTAYAGRAHERIAGGGHYPSVLAPDAYAAAIERLLAAAC